MILPTSPTQTYPRNISQDGDFEKIGCCLEASRKELLKELFATYADYLSAENKNLFSQQHSKEFKEINSLIQSILHEQFDHISEAKIGPRRQLPFIQNIFIEKMKILETNLIEKIKITDSFEDILSYTASERQKIAILCLSRNWELFGSQRAITSDCEGLITSPAEASHATKEHIEHMDAMYLEYCNNLPDTPTPVHILREQQKDHCYHRITLLNEFEQKTIPLTAIIPLFDNIEPPYISENTPCQWIKKPVSHKWVHTHPRFFPQIKKLLESEYKTIREEKDPNTLINGIAKMHWLLCQGCFYTRGSAAIAEAICAALLQATPTGRTLNYKSLPDIDALTYPMDKFTQEYPDKNLEQVVSITPPQE